MLGQLAAQVAETLIAPIGATGMIGRPRAPKAGFRRVCHQFIAEDENVLFGLTCFVI